MPLYEYHCEDCDTEFELRRPMRDSDAETECPNCASHETTRQVSLFVGISKSANSRTSLGGGGCGCGGSCACGGHSMN